MKHAGVLRQARDEVMPQVPVLATYLLEEPTIIRGALQTVVQHQGVEPSQIRRRHWNKLERGTISGYLIDRQRDYLIEGKGSESYFRQAPEALANLKQGQKPSFAIDWLLDKGAEAIENRYSNPNSVEERWWTLAGERYNKLGFRAALGHILIRNDVPEEGRCLQKALRTEALSTVISRYSNFIIDHTEPGPERGQTAHDLLKIPLSRAGISFRQFHESSLRPLPTGTIYLGSDGVYRFKAAPESRNWAKQKRHRDVFTMQCPANTYQLGSDKTKERNLRTYLHASVNFLISHTNFLTVQSDKSMKYFREPAAAPALSRGWLSTVASL
jgi:hypothetical protein